MSAPAELAALAHLLPEERVGTVTAVQPISAGLSGASVYAVSSTRGELVLRVNAPRADTSLWTQQLRILRRASDAGVAPAIVHVNEAARAIVSTRVAGMSLGAALADPANRAPAVASVIAQLRALRSLDTAGIEERVPLPHARRELATQRARPGFPAWAAALEPIFDAIEAVLARDARRVVCHNDLNPGNILWDGARVWFVNWEVAGLNHPFYDLAVLAMFLRLEDAVAHQLLAQLEDRPVNGDARATFAALRRIAALLCGLVFASMVDDLTLLPAQAPTLTECYAGLRAGTLDFQDPRGRGAFALALLRLGTS